MLLLLYTIQSSTHFQVDVSLPSKIPCDFNALDVPGSSLAAVVTGKAAQTAGVNSLEQKGLLGTKRRKKCLSCIYCSIDTWEKKRQESSSATYHCFWNKQPSIEGSVGIKCQRCHSFMCRGCLQQLVLTLKEEDTDQEFILRYLKDNKNTGYTTIPGNISSCCWMKPILTEWKQETNGRIKSLMASPNLDSSIKQFPWDGALLFSEFGLVVPTQLDFLDVHAMAQPSKSQQGVVHGVVPPLTAAELQKYGIHPPHNKSGIVFDRMNVNFTDISGIRNTVNIRCIIVDEQHSCGAEVYGKLPTKEDAMAVTSLCTKEHLDESKKEGIDAHCILGHRPSSNYTFLLLLRFHSYKFATPSFKHSALRGNLHKSLGTYKMECRRWGGSNGFPQVDNDLMEFLHKPGTLPRKAKGVRINPCGRKWRILYKSPYAPAEKKIVEVFYAQPRKGGQLNPTPSLFTESFVPFQLFYGWMKTIVPPMVVALNNTLPGRYTVAHCALERESETIAQNWKESNGKYEQLYKHMSFTHTFSFLEYAVAYHVDVPKRGSQLKGDYSMMEYKFVFEDEFLTGRYKTKGDGIARLRGGAGSGKAAFVIATHEKKRPD